MKPGDNQGIREMGRRTDWRHLLFELFVAVSLFVAYFFMVRNFFSYGNPMSANLFMAGSEKLYRLDQPLMGEHYNGRLSGLLLTGALMDFALNEPGTDQAQVRRLTNVFGLYHACWLLLLFVCIIFALRHSLFILFGIFAGLMYNFTPTSGPYFYPWDMPAMVCFTLAALFYARRQVWMTAILICIGSFFKETVLVCALLILFAGHWKWISRIATFGGVFAVYALGKHWMLSQLNIASPLFSVGAALQLRGAFSPATLADNLADNVKALFAPTLNSVFFVNAGTLGGVLALGWRKRFLPYMTVIVAFIAGLFLTAPPPGISEVRDFMEVLPLSVILLGVLWTEDAGAGASGGNATKEGPTLPLRDTFPYLLPTVIALIALFTSVVALQYYIIFEDLQPANRAQSQLGKFVGYENQKPLSLQAVSQWFKTGYEDAELKLAIRSQMEHRDSDASAQYQCVLEVDTNSIWALNNLATLLATDWDTRLRDGNEAVALAERACQLSQEREPVLLYTLAAAYAEAGRFKDAVAAAEKARSAALARGETELIKQNEPLVDLYKSGRAFHQQPPPADGSR